MVDQNQRIDASSPFADEHAVRIALDQILKSEKFVRSKRIGSFLRFVVEETLAGRGGRLKGFTIAREVYGRDATFDSRADSIVRVEARRLRRLLADYYQTIGGTSKIKIDLPKGGYAPAFSQIKDTIPETAPEPTIKTGASAATDFLKQHLLLSIFTMVTILAVSGWLFFVTDRQPVPGDSVSTVVDTKQSTSTFLVVLPLVTINDDPVEDRMAAGLVEAIVANLAKLSGMSVMAHASLLRLSPSSGNLEAIKQNYGATHALRGSLERDGEFVRANVQLIEIGSSTTIWADILDARVDNPLALQDLLSDRLVNHLAVKVLAEEHTRFKQYYSSNPEALALYRQALILLIPPNDVDRILTARHMFQRIIDIDPGFAGGYAGKGFSHAITVLFLKAENPVTELETAKRYALEAIETDPEFGMGYVTLAFAYAMSGRQEEALFNARRAVAVQPGDAFSQFVYGMSLALSGRPRDALIPLNQALRLDPAEVRTPYRNVLGITHYALGEYTDAARFFSKNIGNDGPTGPHMDVFRAANYASLGENDKAREILREITHTHPEFPIRSWLAKWLVSADDLTRTMSVLYQLGLPQKN